MSQVSGVAVPDAEVAPAPPVRGTSLLRRSLRLWRTRIGVGLVGVIVLLAIVGPYVAPYGPSTPVGAPNSDPGGKAVLGTDYLGQDVLSRLLYGGRSILVMAVIATALGLIAGTVIGLVAAYARNALDDILMRAMDVIMALPQIMLALVAVAIVGPHAWVIVTAIALTTAPRIARVARGAA
ncbi:MAG: ABC transporter permease, partial [Streptosporangiaceae bacterium]